MSRLAKLVKSDPIETFIRMDSAEKVINEQLKDKPKNIESIQNEEMTLVKLMEQLEFMKNQLAPKIAASVVRPLNEVKVILLCERTLKNSEVRELRKHFVIQNFQPSWLGYQMDIAGEFELLIIPLHIKKARTFYASNMQEIMDDDNMHVVYLTKKIRQKHSDAVRSVYNVDFVRKNLPKNVDDQGTYRFLLLVDNISKITHGCFPFIKKLIK